MENQVTLTVDGMEMRVPAGTLLWEACKDHGIDIPIFCYHTKLGPVGACRTCLVELQGAKGPITACSTPVAEGMVVRTRSPLAQKAQRGIFEFLLANHPLDCPICDRGGECPLQDQTFAYGPGSSRYIEPKRHHVKPVALGPTIALDRERCVLCWRCVRFCSEVAEDHSIVLLDRGDHSVVGTFQDQPYVSNFSGNVIELCPVGALTSRKQRFNFRPWELQNRASVCPHCAFGCNINVSVRKNDEVIRFLSRDNPDVDDSWLCDRGRFNFEFINSPERLKSPMVRRGDAFVEVSWPEAFEFIETRLKAIVEEDGPESVVGLASPRLTNEDLFVFKRFMRDTLNSPNLDHFPRPQTQLTSNQVGSLERLDRSLAAIADLDRATTILLLGADPSRREPVMELRIRLAMNRHNARLVVISPDEITLTASADAGLIYPRERIADMTRALSSVIQTDGGRRGSARAIPGIDENALRDIAETYLKSGRVVVLYDDTFDGVTDKADALEAIADLVETLGNGAEVGTIPMLDACNSMGARDLRVLPGETWGTPVLSGLTVPQGPRSGIRAAFLLGANIATDPVVARELGALDLVVVHELFLTDTAWVAHVVLPAASFAEKVGTFTNTERRIQALGKTVPAPGIARADWEILVDLSQYFDRPLDYGVPRDIWDDIRQTVPTYADVSYDEIGARGLRAGSLQPV